jgi:hypothetical protein
VPAPLGPTPIYRFPKSGRRGRDSKAPYDSANRTTVTTSRTHTSPMPPHQMRASRLAHLMHARAEVAGPGPPATRMSTDCIGPNSTPHRKQFQEELIRRALRWLYLSQPNTPKNTATMSARRSWLASMEAEVESEGPVMARMLPRDGGSDFPGNPGNLSLGSMRGH